VPFLFVTLFAAHARVFPEPRPQREPEREPEAVLV
jgi:hypothetical protein